MLLNAVILILQETLEAALLLSILAALAYHSKSRLGWLPISLVAGCILALLYALNLESVTTSFDYIGQELLNASLQILIALSIGGVALAQAPGRSDVEAAGAPRRRLYAVCAALALSMAIAREGSEIFIYLQGFLAQDTWPQSVMTGSFIGFCIGASTGLLLFYGLCAMRSQPGVWVDLALLALFAGNMLSQAVQQLEQASVLPTTVAMWDSSAIIREDSLLGQLLYALVGYESTPSVLQFIGYAAGFTGVALAAVLGRRLDA